MSKNVQRCWQPNHLISYLLYDTRSFCWNASLLNCKWHRLGKLCCAGLHCNLLLTKCRLITCSKRKLYIRNVIGCQTMALQTSIFIGPYKMTWSEAGETGFSFLKEDKICTSTLCFGVTTRTVVGSHAVHHLKLINVMTENNKNKQILRLSNKIWLKMKLPEYQTSLNYFACILYEFKLKKCHMDNELSPLHYLTQWRIYGTVLERDFLLQN